MKLIRSLGLAAALGLAACQLSACSPQQLTTFTSGETKVAGELHAICTVAATKATVLVPIGAAVAQNANSNGAATVDVVAQQGTLACAAINAVYTGTTTVATTQPAPAVPTPTPITASPAGR